MTHQHCRSIIRCRRASTRLYSLLVGMLLATAAGAAHIASPAQAAPSYSILHTFNSYGDGRSPASEAAVVVGSDGNFYGITAAGGTNNYGTIYRLSTTGAIKTLHSFTGTSGDGGTPIGMLAQDSSGNLYGVTESGGANSAGTVYEITESSAAYKILYSFTSASSGAYTPDDGVTLASGYLYGTTAGGGTNGYGSVYKVKTDGTGFTELAQLNTGTSAFGYNVLAPLVVSGSTVYGAALYGGANSNGELFSVSTSGSGYTGIYAFNSAATFSGYYPEGITLGKDGNLYGTTVNGGSSGYGTVFVYKTSSKSASAIYNFTGSTDGGYPRSGVTQDSSSGTLYGRTTTGGSANYGTEYQLSTTGSFKVLQPLTITEYYGGYAAPPTFSGSAVYDTAYSGGATGTGSIYKVTTGSSGSLSVLFDFAKGFADGANPYYSKLLMGSDGALHGTTESYVYNSSYGTAFHVTTSGTYTQDVVTSGNPYGSLIQLSDGSYLGTTWDGGYYSAGSVFSFTSGDSSSFEDVYDFGQSAGANVPAALMLGSDGNYYGASYYGGQRNDGCIFRLTPDFVETVLYSFRNTGDGANPNGGLIEDSSGNFYGTTVNGGASNDGTVFKLSPSDQLTTLLVLDGSSLGSNPYSELAISGNSLYGTARYGGPNGTGTVFSVSTTGTSAKTIYSFGNGGANGTNPYAGVTEGTDGHLYGTTVYGGANGYGVVYSLSTRSGTESVLHSFANNGTDGYYPYTEVAEGADGNLYGTTLNGGAVPSSEPGDYVDGIVYQLKTALPVVTKFSPTSGAPGTSVTLTGSNLASASSVTFNGTSATITSDTSTTIKVTVPTGATTGSLQVTTPTASDNAGTFTVLGGPSSLTLNPTTVTGGGGNSTGTVTLSAAAPSGGTNVSLSSSDTSAAAVPSSVTVASGSTSATFTVTSKSVSSSTTVTISASAMGTTQTATLKVDSPSLSGLSLSPTSVKGGSANATGTVTLNAPAPSGGTSVSLSSSNTSALTVPSSVTVAAGSTTGTFTATSKTVSSSTTVTVSATRGSTTKTATETVTH